MKKIIAVATCFLILSAADIFAAGDYRLTVKLQEFSFADGKPVDLKEVLSDAAGLGQLTAGEIEFLHRTRVSTGGTIEEEVQIGKTDAKMSYVLGTEKEGAISVTVSIQLTETVAVKDGVPIKSVRSVKTTIDCPIGQEIKCGGGAAGGNKVSLFTIIVTK